MRLDNISRLIVLGLCFFIMSNELRILSFSNAIYFMIGIGTYQSKKCFISIFQPSGLAVIPLLLLSCFPENLDSSTLSGIVITYLVISMLLFLYRYIPSRMKQIVHFIGRNTFVILIFSPVFTILSKIFVPFFSFDSSGICFMCISVTFVITGCMAIAWIMDWLKLSRFCFGKERIIQ